MIINYKIKIVLNAIDHFLLNQIKVKTNIIFWGTHPAHWRWWEENLQG